MSAESETKAAFPISPEARLTAGIRSWVSNFIKLGETDLLFQIVNEVFTSRNLSPDEGIAFITKFNIFSTHPTSRVVGERDAKIMRESLGGSHHTLDSQRVQRSFAELLDEALEVEVKDAFSPDEKAIMVDLALHLRAGKKRKILIESAKYDPERRILLGALRDETYQKSTSRIVDETSILIRVLGLIEARRKFEYEILGRKVGVVRSLRTDLRTSLFYDEGRSRTPFVTHPDEVGQDIREAALSDVFSLTEDQENEREWIIKEFRMWEIMKFISTLRIKLEEANLRNLLVESGWNEDERDTLALKSSEPGLRQIADKNQMSVASAFIAQREANGDQRVINSIHEQWVKAKEASKKR